MARHAKSVPPEPAGERPEVSVSEWDGVRYLHLGTEWVQGAMRLSDPQVLVLDYVQRMMAGLLWRPVPEMTHGPAVQLGLGAGALTRFTHRTLRMKTVVVELNPAVVAANRALFRLPADGPRLAVVQADAAAWAAEPAHHGRASLLHVDLYDHEAAAPVLDDEGFYADCRRVLADGGVMTVNLFGRQASFDDSAARIAAAFGADTGPGGPAGSPLWMLKPTREGNTIVIASRGAPLPAREELALRAAHVEDTWGLPARKWLRILKPWTPR